MLRFERFDAWKVAHQLALTLYQVTDHWPRSERYELTTQLRRAVLSVPANIAEGSGKRSKRELQRYLDIALGSLAEVSYLLLFARDRGVLPLNEWESLDLLRDRAGQLIWGWMRSLSRSGKAAVAPEVP